jgi:hypothetical protein
VLSSSSAAALVRRPDREGTKEMARKTVVITRATVVKGVGPVYPAEDGKPPVVVECEAADADELVRLERARPFDAEKDAPKKGAKDKDA